MNKKIHVTVEELINIFKNDKSAIDLLNQDINNILKISDNPLQKKKFTYGEYQNWIKINSSFTLKEYKKRFN